MKGGSLTQRRAPGRHTALTAAARSGDEAGRDGALALLAAVDGNEPLATQLVTGLDSAGVAVVGRAAASLVEATAAVIRSRARPGTGTEPVLPPGFTRCLACLSGTCGVCDDPACAHGHGPAGRALTTAKRPSR